MSKELIIIDQLNHASLLMKMGEVHLLTDPWYEGEVFEGGWTLQVENPKAYELAATATHLWISHPHADHFHLPTLKKIYERNPKITILLNISYNYDIRPALESIGFKNIIPLYENKPLALSDDCTITRYGSGVIDSLMVIQWRGQTIVNLNDCVLQKVALKWLVKKTGQVDLLLCNFNHAGKLLHYPAKEPQEIQSSLFSYYQERLDTLHPRYAMAFAGFHCYASPHSTQQNATMITPDDLSHITSGDCANISLYPGQQLTLDLSASSEAYQIAGERAATKPAASDDQQQETPLTIDEIMRVSEKLSQRVRGAYGPLRFLVPSIRIRLSEIGEIIEISGRGVKKIDQDSQADIEAPIQKVISWFEQPFGTDAFAVGAHFSIISPRVGRLKLLLALLLLAESKVAPRYMLSLRFWKFIYQRKHEALAALLNWRVTSSYQ